MTSKSQIINNNQPDLLSLSHASLQMVIPIMTGRFSYMDFEPAGKTNGQKKAGYNTIQDCHAFLPTTTSSIYDLLDHSKSQLSDKKAIKIRIIYTPYN